MPTRSMIYSRVIPGRHKHSDAAVPSRGHHPAEDTRKKAWERKGGPLFPPRAEPHPRHARATPGHQPRRFTPSYGEQYLFSALWPILHRCRRYLFPSQTFKFCVLWQVQVGPEPPCCSRLPSTVVRPWAGIDRAHMNTHLWLLNACLCRKPAAPDTKSTRSTYLISHLPDSAHAYFSVYCMYCVDHVLYST